MDREFQFLMYRSAEEDVTVNAVIKDETIWLTQKAMAELFAVDKSSISRHLRNIFAEGELDEEVVVAKIASSKLQAGNPFSHLGDRRPEGVHDEGLRPGR